jgi:hypothetical protein
MAGQQSGSKGGGNKQGGQRGDGRGFAGMDDDQQREIASKGGEASARSQERDVQGQFAGSKSGGPGSSGGSSGSGGGRGSGSSKGGSSKSGGR